MTTPSFPAASGPMSDLVRTHDWRSTALGPVKGWSACLRIATEMVLASDFPNCLVWGPGLITIYNQAFRPILGHKPGPWGARFVTCGARPGRRLSRSSNGP